MVKIESLVAATDVVSHIGTLATPSSSHVVEPAQRMVYICYNITIVFIMVVTTIQKVIKIGSSRGVTLPAKQLKALGIRDGDEIEITIRKHPVAADDDQVLKAANKLLKRYRIAFSRLAKR